MDSGDHPIDRDVRQALQRLRDAAVVPPAEPSREAALMAAFDGAHARPPAARRRTPFWYMAGLAAAAAILIAVGIGPGSTGRHGPLASLPRDVQLEPSEFVMVPGAASLPPMESGTLVRMEVPVSLLPSYGVTPPAAGRVTVVTADVVVAQDGLPRAVRLVN
jgi:hypothetical protein